MTLLPMLLGIPGSADISFYAIFQGDKGRDIPFCEGDSQGDCVQCPYMGLADECRGAWAASLLANTFPVLDSPCLTCQPAHSAAQSEICRILLFLFLPVLIKLRDYLLDGWLADFDVQDSLRPGQPLRHPPDGQPGPNLPQIQTRRSFH